MLRHLTVRFDDTTQRPTETVKLQRLTHFKGR